MFKRHHKRLISDPAISSILFHLFFIITTMKTFNDTKADGTSQPRNNDYLNENLTPAQEAVMFDNGQDSPKERMSDGAVKGGAWLLGILAVFGICLLVTWAIDKSHAPFSTYASRTVVPRTTDVRTPVMATTPQPATQLMATAPQPATQLMAIVIPVAAPSINTQAAAPTTKTAVKPLATTPTAMSKADQDRINREALEVIHGDFGNNPGRKAKLGADYAAVQARVNQLLHI